MLQIIVDSGTLRLFGTSIPLRIYGYGLMLVFGFLLGILLAQWRARRAGENPEHLAHCGLLALLGGIIGARIAYIIQHWKVFSRSEDVLGEIFNVTSGGLIYYGGVVLATIIVVLYLLIKRRPIRRYLDIVAVSLMIGLAFGRAGCTLNGCCFGARCSDHWALGMRFPMYSKPLVKFDGRENPYSAGTRDPSPLYAHQMETGEIKPDSRLTYETGVLIPPRDFTNEQIAVADASWSKPVKPAQLLGLINALILAVLLTLFYRARRREGQVFALLVMLYPITRFVLEMIRDDNPHNLLSGILTHNQYTSMVMFAAGLTMWLVLYRLPASAGPVLTQRLAAAKSRRTYKERQ